MRLQKETSNMKMAVVVCQVVKQTVIGSIMVMLDGEFGEVS